jgi:hypothetical protein
MQNFILKLLLVRLHFTSAQSSAQNVQIDNRLVQIARSRVNTIKICIASNTFVLILN